MTAPDIQQLQQESLSESRFPANAASDFRLFIDPAVHQGIQEHASRDTEVEICGVLVGEWLRDEHGPYAKVSQYIRCNQAASKFAEVTFTHESWSQINGEMDSKYADLRIIGWYHSHPDFGIFLSDRDVFIQENFFSGPGQVAYVVDPVRKLEGVFEWKSGKPVLMSHYWVGDDIWSITASEKPSGSSAQQASADPAAGGNYEERMPPMRGSVQIVMGLCLFLIGYLLAGTKSRWEQEMIVTGVVDHYGTHKLMKVGFEDHLRQVNQQLVEVNKLFRTLPLAVPEDANAQQIAEAKKKQVYVANALTLCSQALLNIEKQYGLTDQERQALSRYIQRKQRELRNPQTADSPAEKNEGASQSDAPAASSESKTEIPASETKTEKPPAGESKSLKSQDE
ncbi:Mov34/MPN/PAD-1 family protein [Gimesia panareensis]|uniref:Mov34/MPN/PAD-1 family protein n=1 Tax=Gimesia panareensis TaxID=2527978 RepID=A0A518FVY2_9PLAN|nr:Mov34/MPN/PAD-1 family protein [Gimesia panareensis]QDV20491.1 Mov34/MPN/PAD-1 family protein [Gimesia panareensis]